ncbi:hypothetical protein BGZ65_001923, partial [Modicella reniformis]
MSLAALSARLFPTVRSQAMARVAAPSSSAFARFYGIKKYSADHEYIDVDNDIGKIGITDFAQKQLGEVVFVDFDYAVKNPAVEAGGSLGNVESVKAVSEIFSPVSGKIIEANEALTDEPQMINEDPEGDGWIVKIKLSNLKELDTLMTKEAYEKFIKE